MPSIHHQHGARLAPLSLNVTTTNAHRLDAQAALLSSTISSLVATAALATQATCAHYAAPVTTASRKMQQVSDEVEGRFVNA